MAIRHSQEITDVVEKRLCELTSDIDDTARELARTAATDHPRIQILLRELHSRYPNIDHFLMMDRTGRITEYSPIDGASENIGRLVALLRPTLLPVRTHPFRITSRFE